ncbi:MAG: alpha-amylase family glycosyl hydrolase [Xanthomonadales bacterium]|nr:alpha-amylase family glycosyl hydrolase [Xanthomonadales bacterium]
MRGRTRGWVLVSLAVLSGCAHHPPTSSAPEAAEPYEAKPYVRLTNPEWTRRAALYQINTRQFTPEGTFRAAIRELPRLRELGVEILWLMPIHPIGEKNRKGSLGSPYAVRDYFGVNPEFGTLDDLKAFVAAAHDQGMYVILDWVANHTAWDNPLVDQHPEWYARDWKGQFRPTPWWDWSDIIDLDYANADLRRYMADALKYWVREADIDGYRCDVAGYVPLDFWNQVRAELDAIKPVFMLAEWESRDLHAEAFDMTYAWEWYEAMHRIASGDAGVDALFRYYSKQQSAFPEGAMRMLFVSNHDKNAWEATQFEAFGDALPAAIALSVVSEGTPLIYNGQEAGNPRRLAFFEKDPIEWRSHPVGDLYRDLLRLKRNTSALWNGRWGAPMIQVVNSAPQSVFSFVRRDGNSQVLAVFNFSDEAREVILEDADLVEGRYSEFPDEVPVSIEPSVAFQLDPWAYRILVQDR